VLGVLCQALNDLALPNIVTELVGQENIGYQLGSRLLDLFIVLNDQIEGRVVELLPDSLVDLGPNWLGGDERELGTDHLGHGHDDDLSKDCLHGGIGDQVAKLEEEVSWVGGEGRVDLGGVLGTKGVVWGLIGVVEPLNDFFCLYHNYRNYSFFINDLGD
jgi:hypothetical protein